MQYVQIILSAAKSVKISGAILVAMCSHESGLKNIVTPHDGGSASIGICQVKLETATMLGYSGTASGLMNPQTNAKFAALYLKYQFERYQNWCMAIAAYNAGRYNESRKEPGHPRNIKYVLNVGKKLNKHFQKTISCDRVFTEGTDVAENNGAGRRIQSAKP
jgi:soluble lytic murein transglycosylase-like protein